MKMAGLYDMWRNGDEEVFTYTIVTITSSGTSLAWLHDRMPVILSDEGAEVKQKREAEEGCVDLKFL